MPAEVLGDQGAATRPVERRRAALRCAGRLDLKGSSHYGERFPFKYSPQLILAQGLASAILLSVPFWPHAVRVINHFKLLFLSIVL
jgi:hypothetical protein